MAATSTRWPNKSKGSAVRASSCVAARPRGRGQYVDPARIGREREGVAVGERLRVKPERQAPVRAAQFGVYLVQRARQSLEVVRVLRVAEVHVLGDHRRAVRDPGQAADQDISDPMSSKQADDRLGLELSRTFHAVPRSGRR